MKAEYYNPVDEKGSCIFRAISKAINKSYFDVKKDLNDLANKLGYSDAKNDKVFEKYLETNGFNILEKYNNIMLMDASLLQTNIVVINVGDWYHMICVIDNVIYDKNSLNDLDKSVIIKVYKQDNLK